MTKKSIDIQDEIEKIQAAKPVILKCSYKFAREIRHNRMQLIMANSPLKKLIDTMQIKPVGNMPDHVVILCNAKNQVIKMINLTARPKQQKPIIIH